VGFVQAGTLSGGNFRNGSFSQLGHDTTGSITIPAGRTLRAVLIFSKMDNAMLHSLSAPHLRNSMTFELRNSAGTIQNTVSSCPIQNVHIIEYSVAGTYNLRATLTKINGTGAGVNYTILWKVT
jgi:hypothetical protein